MTVQIGENDIHKLTIGESSSVCCLWDKLLAMLKKE